MGGFEFWVFGREGRGDLEEVVEWCGVGRLKNRELGVSCNENKKFL